MDMDMEAQGATFNSLGKRLREDDAAITTDWSEQPHRKLVFRTPSVSNSSNLFATHQNPSLPGPNTPTLTPADSSEEDEREIRSPPLGPSVAVPSTVFTPADDDIDMDMDGDTPIDQDPHTPQRHSRGPSSPMLSPKSQTPTRSNSRQGRLAPIMLGTPTQSTDLSTRVPTPIYGHFSTHEQPTPPPNATGSPLPHHHRTNHYNLALYPHGMHERKMPSPISEDFAGDAMMHGVEGHQQYAVQMQRLQAHGIVDEDMAMSPASPTATGFMQRSPSAGPGLQRRRSDAISGASTPVEGPNAPSGPTSAAMSRQNSNQGSENGIGLGVDGLQGRTIFRMGYKSDCRLCRDRVPGHFSHISHTGH